MGRRYVEEVALIPENYQKIEQWIATCTQYGRPMIRTTEKKAYLICYDKGKVKGMRLRVPPEILEDVRSVKRGKTKRFLKIFEELKAGKIKLTPKPTTITPTKKPQKPKPAMPKEYKGEELAKKLWGIASQLPKDIQPPVLEDVPRTDKLRMLADDLVHLIREYLLYFNPEGHVYEKLKRWGLIRNGELDVIYKGFEKELGDLYDAYDQMYNIIRRIIFEQTLSNKETAFLEKLISYINKVYPYAKKYDEVISALEKYGRLKTSIVKTITTHKLLREVLDKLELYDDIINSTEKISRILDEVRMAKIKWSEAKDLLKKESEKLEHTVETAINEIKRNYPTIKEELIKELANMPTAYCVDVFKEFGLVPQVINNLDNPYKLIDEIPKKVRSKFYRQFFIDRLWDKDLKGFFRRCIDTYVAPLQKLAKEKDLLNEIKDVLSLKEFNQNDLSLIASLKEAIEGRTHFEVYSTKRMLTRLMYYPQGNLLEKSKLVLSCKDIGKLEKNISKLETYYRPEAEYLVKYFKTLCSEFPDGGLYEQAQVLFFARPNWKHFRIEVYRSEYMLRTLLKP